MDCTRCGYAKMVRSNKKDEPYTYICGIISEKKKIGTIKESMCEAALKRMSPWVFAHKGVYIDFEDFVKTGVSNREMMHIFLDAYTREFIATIEDLDLFALLTAFSKYARKLEAAGLCNIVYDIDGKVYSDIVFPAYTLKMTNS